VYNSRLELILCTISELPEQAPSAITISEVGSGCKSPQDV
jgi:hypothetical protein